ncbi:family 16 glycosylhydrolase, partial [Methylobacterium sp. 37f]|uniref:family 16 glycosylhydrolase n=1 Tax=Methylobacterium sp. 37f TaxID=2817058 RepID=UPI001FFC5A02
MPESGPRTTAATFGSVKGTTYMGTAGNNAFRSTASDVTFVGGAGDDAYIIAAANTKIVENAGEGTDTVTVYGGRYTLGDNLENLNFQGVGTGFGNATANLIVGNADAQTFDGGLGNDVMTGGGGADGFVLTKGTGHDVVTDFVSGIDHIQLNNYPQFASFTSLQAAMTQVGADVVLNLGEGDSLTLRNMTVSGLKSADFWLPVGSTNLTFADEFDSFTSSPNAVYGTDGWRTTFSDGSRTIYWNGERQYYGDATAGQNPFSVEDGALKITVSNGATNDRGLPYNSGLITSEASFSQLYGYFEIRAQIPSGAGFWPAFWLLPADGSSGTELDVLEALGSDPATYYATFHTDASGKSIGNTQAVYTTMDLSKGFHSYGVDWGPSEISWYLDGNKVASAPTPADMHVAMYMLANLAVGGWGGNTNAATTFPSTYAIDYIHVYENQYTVTENADPIGAPIVSGTAAQGQTVQALRGTLTDADGVPTTLRYQWQRDDGNGNWVTIDQAQGREYVLTQADVGHDLKVMIRYADGHGIVEHVVSSNTIAGVANVNDLPTGQLALAGMPTQGETLTASLGTLADLDGLGTLAFQWQRDDGAGGWTSIAGATADRYVLGQADVGHSLQAVASYFDGFGASEEVFSFQTTPVANINDLPTGSLALSGTARQGQVLTAAPGTLADADGLGVLNYQWLRDDGKGGWQTITSATKSTYTLGAADVGHAVQAMVSYTDGMGTAESVRTTASGIIASDGSVTPPQPTAPSGTAGKVFDVGTGSTALTLHISQDSIQGNALYAVYVDGKQVGTTLTGSALHGQAFDTVNVHADLSAGKHAIAVRYLSDSWGSAGDHNLYVESAVDAFGNALTVTGSALLDVGNVARATLTTGSSTGTVSPPPPPPPP